jgi:hypothetical protein
LSDAIRGPWEHDSRNIYDSAGEVVCRADWDMNSEDGSAERWEARAPMLVAAPQMLALLRDFEGATFCPSCDAHGFHQTTCALALMLERFPDVEHPMSERKR